MTANEIVKEQMIQTTSKKIVRSSEKQKPRATSGLKVLCNGLLFTLLNSGGEFFETHPK